MFKKESVFWWSCCIFVAALILFAVTQNQIFLMLIVAAFLLRPTLASLGFVKKLVDERELSINYRSSNLAFFVVMIGCVFFAAKLESENDHAYEMFYMVIVIGIVAKTLFYTLLTNNFRNTGPKIIITVGLFIALFSGIGSIEHGVFSFEFIMNILPGLILTVMGVISKYYPRAIAVAIFLATVSLMIFIIRNEITWATTGTALIVGVPLLSASLGLWKDPKEKVEE